MHCTNKMKRKGFTLLSKKTKGFTLIELIVVIVVIGILVLLASPMIIGYGREAKLTQIKSDAKVAEGIMEHYLAINGALPDGLTSVDLTTPLSEGRLLGPDGLLITVDGDPSGYVDVTDLSEVKSIKSKLDGQFVANEMGRVYYLHTKTMNDGDSDSDLVVADDQVYVDESVDTLADLWGEDAKEVFALVIALDSMGVTPASPEDAYALYEDLKGNNPALLSQIISVQPAIWTGAYNEVTQDLNNIKDGFATWLTGLFGTLGAGQLVKEAETYHVYDGTQSIIGTYKGKTSSTYNVVWYESDILKSVPVKVENGVFIIGNNEYTYVLSTQNDSYYYDIRVNPNYSVSVMWRGYDMSKNVELKSANYNSYGIIISTIPQSQIMKASISADAPVLDGGYDAETDRRYPEAPWLGAHPGSWEDAKMATSDGKDIFLGSIDRYINDAVNVLTWDDIDKSSASYYGGNPAKRATLTPAAGGLLEVNIP